MSDVLDELNREDTEERLLAVRTPTQITITDEAGEQVYRGPVELENILEAVAIWGGLDGVQYQEVENEECSIDPTEQMGTDSLEVDIDPAQDYLNDSDDREGLEDDGIDEYCAEVVKTQRPADDFPDDDYD